ncbi:hypothetical protein [Micromonospora endolithica]|uniref:LPXTG cell wall anchor domain-containing protein n=1 Tax=Micromonospora endolithica TaxID=230091 RepID=A0A3A9YXM5_9ACTN|nr:hypothetical protein [Micromonospora endolithica]RKN40685.1 hypothetical protein D7223_26520 [Micromonospora endolithica]TWJ21779.1 hypothetical protein JD76_01891 [Micromonospora endolithica]
MRLTRIIMALTVGLAVVAVPTAAGAAQPQPQPPVVTATPQPPVYPPGPATLTVNPPTVTVGTTVQLVGSGFLPGETVNISYTTTPFAAGVPGADRARRSDGSAVAMAPVSFQQAPTPTSGTLVATAGPDGTFTIPFTPYYPGKYTFTAVGATSGKVATATLIVLKKKQPPLPVTGDSLGTPMKVGGGLVGAGAVLLLLSVAWRKRHRFGIGTTR